MKGRNAHGKKENKTQLQRQSVSDDIPGEEGAFKPLQCHQSSWNPNMPLRGLIYINMVYQGYIAQHHLDLYSSTLLKLPTPRYIVFYNGTGNEPDQQELRLSDSFIQQDGSYYLECRATVLKREREQNAQILQKHIQSTRQLLLQFLASRWQLPEEVLKRVSEETDSDTLAAWASFAIGCDSAKEMEKLILKKGQ